MQTIAIPYKCDAAGSTLIAECRAPYSCGVRTAYANSADADGQPLPARLQRKVRNLVKSRFAGGGVDAWTLHCASLEGMEMRRAKPDGKAVFGGRANLLRRQKGLISNEEWKSLRLRPLSSRGDKTFAGNRHFRLAPDGRSCIFRMYGRSTKLILPYMTGNAGEVLRQAAALAAAKKINLTFRIDATHLYVVIDPEDIPEHPERRRPVVALRGHAIGIDLNPSWIGIAAIRNADDPSRLDMTTLLDHTLLKLEHDPAAPVEQVREVLSAACDRAIGLARKHHAGLIVVEKGLGKLRSGGRNKKHNQLLNYWGRTVFVQMLRRKAALAGIKVVEVWGGYSTTIGNLAFEAPDACASAAEIARRGLALRAGIKELLPIFDEGWPTRLRKDVPLPAEVGTWVELHRAIKAAKTFGYRRPHPAKPPDPGIRHVGGYAVHRLGRRRRPGTVFLPACPRNNASSRKTVTQLKREGVSTVFAG